MSTDRGLARLLELVDSELDRAVALRHQLHAAPELSHRETTTAEAIATALELPTIPAVGTGLLAHIGRADEPAVAVRAELDGLPVTERTAAPFRSTNGAMHACGHDVHAAALVALARATSRMADELPAPLLAVFQPSEEDYPSGAELMVRHGALPAGTRAVVATHVHPDVKWGGVALDPGRVNASCDNVEIIIEGKAAHAGYPHLGRDPVLAIAHAITALHTIVARRVDPLRGAVVTVGRLSAGSAENVIPAQARAGVTLRALDPEDRESLRRVVEEVVEGTARTHGCSGRVELTEGEPALENDAAIVAVARDLLPRSAFALAPAWRSCGADDFAYFGTRAPIAMAFVGLDGGPGFTRRPLHHPEFLPPDDAIRAVARVHAALYVAAAISTPSPTP